MVQSDHVQATIPFVELFDGLEPEPVPLDAGEGVLERDPLARFVLAPFPS